MHSVERATVLEKKDDNWTILEKKDYNLVMMLMLIKHNITLSITSEFLLLM